MPERRDSTANSEQTRSSEADELIKKLRSRDTESYQLISMFYAKRLIGLARSRLPEKLASKIDPEDVVQSALKSFFIRSERGEFDNLNDSESYWHLLAKITRRKCGHKADMYFAESRNPGREQGIDAAWEAVARGPTPHEATVLIETIELLTRDLPPHQLRMATMLLEGRKPSEIAMEIGYSKRMVERLREGLRERLQKMFEEDYDILDRVGSTGHKTQRIEDASED